MRPDVQPIGKKLPDMGKHARQERKAAAPVERVREPKEHIPFVTDRDPADEDEHTNTSER
jgi:hypothetical protein